MLAIKGIYDGKTIRLLESPPTKQYKVIITFLEELEDAEQIRNFAAQTDSFEFWEDAREDIYQDYLSKKQAK